jgi:hypothetical protein
MKILSGLPMYVLRLLRSWATGTEKSTFLCASRSRRRMPSSLQSAGRPGRSIRASRGKGVRESASSTLEKWRTASAGRSASCAATQDCFDNKRLMKRCGCHDSGRRAGQVRPRTRVGAHRINGTVPSRDRRIRDSDDAAAGWRTSGSAGNGVHTLPYVEADEPSSSTSATPFFLKVTSATPVAASLYSRLRGTRYSCWESMACPTGAHRNGSSWATCGAARPICSSAREAGAWICSSGRRRGRRWRWSETELSHCRSAALPMVPSAQTGFGTMLQGW